jgi:hypothetical protein
MRLPISKLVCWFMAIDIAWIFWQSTASQFFLGLWFLFLAPHQILVQSRVAFEGGTEIWVTDILNLGVS